MKNLLSPSLYLFTILLVLSGCASKPNVHADSDPNQNFSEYRIFTWTNDNPMIVQSDYIVSPFVGQRVMDAIKSELEDKGYKYTQDLGEADFAIAFTIGARDKVKTRTEPTFVHTNWTWGGQYWGTAVVDVERTVTYTKGTLAIDAFDVKRRAPVWHGVGSKKLSRKQKKADGEGVEEAVRLILTKFPRQG